MVVVDTNVIAAVYLESPLASRAEALMQRDGEWVVPQLWRSELRNALVKELRHRRLSLAEAQRIQREAEDLLSDAEYEVNSERILELANESGCSAYDCEFVALAEFLDVPLVTVDSQVLAAFPGRAVPLPDA
jgi:predicted nucleic acid-binding protein